MINYLHVWEGLLYTLSEGVKWRPEVAEPMTTAGFLATPEWRGGLAIRRPQSQG